MLVVSGPIVYGSERFYSSFLNTLKSEGPTTGSMSPLILPLTLCLYLTTYNWLLLDIIAYPKKTLRNTFLKQMAFFADDYKK